MSTHCPRCDLEFDGGPCPDCGLVSSQRDERGFLERYVATVWQILTQPSQFFRSMPLQGGLAGPLAFALITHWLGSALAFLWQAAIGGMMARQMAGFLKMFQDVADIDYPGRGAQVLELQQRLTHWVWGAGSVILDPFLTLASILFTAFFVFIGARLFVTPGKDGAPTVITYESALRIIAFGMTPAILAALPILGGIVSGILVLIVTVIAAREVYRIPTGRAILVALFPKLLFLGILLMGALFLFFAVFKLFASLI